MTDTTFAAVANEFPLVHCIFNGRRRTVEAHIAALSAQLKAANQRAYDLAFAIAGGEDAPGLLDSVSTDDLCKMIRDERSWARDAEFSARAEGKAEGLREAAGCIGHITRFEDLDAILALIPADTPAAGGRDE